MEGPGLVDVGGQGGCERKLEVTVKLIKKSGGGGQGGCSKKN